MGDADGFTHIVSTALALCFLTMPRQLSSCPVVEVIVTLGFNARRGASRDFGGRHGEASAAVRPKTLSMDLMMIGGELQEYY